MTYYKRFDDQIQWAEYVHGPGFDLLPDNHETHTYPVDGWYYATSLQQALQLMEAGSGVPNSITKRQLYRGLMHVGWLGTTMAQIDASVNSMINAMPAQVKEIARVEFFTSRDFLRTNPMLVSALMSPPLSKTAQQVDEFFQLCAGFAPEGET